MRHFLIQTSLKLGGILHRQNICGHPFTAEGFGRIQGGDAQSDMADIAIRREVLIREEHSPGVESINFSANMLTRHPLWPAQLVA